MGAVAEMRRKWERDDARRRSLWRELLWAVPVLAAFLIGVIFVPRTGSAWLDALLWAVYGALLMALLLLGFRLCGAAPPGFPVRLVFLLTVVISVQRLFPGGSPGDGWEVLLFTGVVTPIVLLADYATSRRKRRGAAPGAP
jgi:hypothetical protein